VLEPKPRLQNTFSSTYITIHIIFHISTDASQPPTGHDPSSGKTTQTAGASRNGTPQPQTATASSPKDDVWNGQTDTGLPGPRSPRDTDLDMPRLDRRFLPYLRRGWQADYHRQLGQRPGVGSGNKDPGSSMHRLRREVAAIQLATRRWDASDSQSAIARLRHGPGQGVARDVQQTVCTSQNRYNVSKAVWAAAPGGRNPSPPPKKSCVDRARSSVARVAALIRTGHRGPTTLRRIRKRETTTTAGPAPSTGRCLAPTFPYNATTRALPRPVGGLGTPPA